MNKGILKIIAMDKLQWLTLDKEGHVLTSQECENFAAVPHADIPFVILLPGFDVYCERVSLPKTSRAEALQALPFLLEEKVIDDVENLHIVANKIPASDDYVVAAINKNKFTELYQALQNSDLRPSAIIPDFFAYPDVEHAWMLHAEPTHLVVRLSTYAGFSVKHPHADLALAHAATTVTVQRQVFDLTVFEKPVINFLQGPYILKTKTKNRSLWSWVGYLAAAFLTLTVGGKLLQWGIYQHRYNQEYAQTVAAFHELMPNTAYTAESKTLIQHELQHLTHKRHTDTFLILLAALGSVMQQFNAVELQAFNYSDQALTIKLKSNKLTELEKLMHALEQHSLKIVRNQVSVNNGTVVAEIRVMKT